MAARVIPFTLTPFEVFAQTGFLDFEMLLSFVLIVCNGGVDVVTKRVSKLTWYKKWFLYFECVCGRSITNTATSLVAFGIKNAKNVQIVMYSKIRMVLHAQKQ